MNFLTLSDITLHFDLQQAAADKPILVFANSLGTDFRIWDGVRDRLGADYTTLCYDKRGHGLSSLGKPPYSMADHVADLTGLLDHLELTNVIICGLSVGGMIAQGVYASRPDLVRALILTDTGHKIGDADLWQSRIDAVLKDGLSVMTETVMERWFTKTFREPENPVYQGCCAMFERQDPRGYAGTCAAIRDTDFTEQAKAIMVPVLCLVGAEDRATSPTLVRELADLIPDAEFQSIEAAGHIPCLEQTEAFTTQLEAFIKGFMDQEGRLD